MAGQGIRRREVLRILGTAAAAATFQGFSKWGFACGHIGNAALSIRPASYHPQFFSVPEYAMVERLADIIIPSDGTPGAKEAGVAEFIDFMVANRVPVSASHDIRSTADAIEIGNETQNRFISGLDWINARCHSEFGHLFMDCTPEQQNSLLEELAYKAKFKPTTESGRAFFQLMREYTVVGYYTTKVGLESLGYAGLRTVWPSMPGCTHPDDPEHVHLREPAS
jgi:hypothetical protein